MRLAWACIQALLRQPPNQLFPGLYPVGPVRQHPSPLPRGEGIRQGFPRLVGCASSQASNFVLFYFIGVAIAAPQDLASLPHTPAPSRLWWPEVMFRIFGIEHSCISPCPDPKEACRWPNVAPKYCHTHAKEGIGKQLSWRGQRGLVLSNRSVILQSVGQGQRVKAQPWNGVMRATVPVRARTTPGQSGHIKQLQNKFSKLPQQFRHVTLTLRSRGRGILSLRPV